MQRKSTLKESVGRFALGAVLATSAIHPLLSDPTADPQGSDGPISLQASHQLAGDKPDADNDTFPDELEISLGTDPESKESFPEIDSDGDGLTDAFEKGVTRYKLVKERITWDEAKREAQKQNLHLATVTSQEEWNAIVTVTELSQRSLNGVWLGGTDEGSEGDWRWTTGEPWSFTQWNDRTNEPSSFDDDDFLSATTSGELG